MYHSSVNLKLRRIFVVVLSQFKSYILIKSHKWHAPIHKKKKKKRDAPQLTP